MIGSEPIIVSGYSQKESFKFSLKRPMFCFRNIFQLYSDFSYENDLSILVCHFSYRIQQDTAIVITSS